MLGVSGLAATLSGIGFAVCGYFNTHLAEKIIEEKLQARIDRELASFRAEVQEENQRMQEAMQKIIAGYNAQFNQNNIQLAISLYEQAVEICPLVYNGYTSLAYSYWAVGEKLKV